MILIALFRCIYIYKHVYLNLMVFWLKNFWANQMANKDERRRKFYDPNKKVCYIVQILSNLLVLEILKKENCLMWIEGRV